MSATVIPSPPSGLTGGESRVLDRLKACYRDSEGVFIYVQPRIRKLEPDFIVIDPSRGIAIIEVKDWKLESIDFINKREVRFSNGSQDKNPAFKTNLYFNLVQGVLADEELYDENGKLVPTLTARLVMSRMSSANLDSLHDVIDIFPCQAIPSSEIPKMSFQHIHGESPRQMSEEQMTVCRASLFPEIKIQKHPDEIVEKIKACDSEQEAFAKRLSHGHHMVSGVPGSGKTVILLSRALHLAKENPDWQIMIMSYNKSLVSRLASRVEAIADDLKFMGIPYQNITIKTFHSQAQEIANMNIPQNAPDEFWRVTLPNTALRKATAQ
jgi:hypothetical protein